MLGTTATNNAGLANTGRNDTLSLLSLAVGLLALGGMFVMISGRRRRVTASRRR